MTAPNTRAHHDDVDLRVAIDELRAGRAMLAAAAALDKRERTEARKVALAKCALAARMVDEVVARYPGEQPVARDRYMTCDSPGTVVDEHGNFPPLAE